MNSKITFLLVIASLCLSIHAFAGPPSDAKAGRTEVVIYDDWPADALLSEGSVTCVGGDIEWINEVTPYCPTGQIRVRDVVLYACVQSEDPRASGVAAYVVNGDFDFSYSGPVWGRWTIVPSDDCNPLDLIYPTEHWKGFWWGERSQDCASGDCLWLGELRLAGRGRGGDIDSLRIHGVEIITTFTPMPVPWELVPIPGLPAGPEGIIEATITDKKSWYKGH